MYAVDVANYSVMQKLFSTIDNEYLPLKGIIHSAFTLHDSMLVNITKEKILSNYS